MKSRHFLALALLLGIVLPGRAAPAQGSGIFNVRDFGATGSGTNKDTVAFQKALDACKTAGGGTVSVPNGIYLIGSIVLGDNTTLELDGRANLIGSPDSEDYPLVRIRWEGEYAQGHRALIYAEKAGHIAVVGHGFIYGPPVTVSRLRDPRGPALIETAECKDVTLDGFSTQYQQLWSIHPLLCTKFTARNLTIRSVNFNGDGIDVDSCQNVLIEHCSIDTGDDAISLKSGRGQAAANLARPTQDVVIRDCNLNSSIFAAIGVGSELSGGIRNVRLENCVISGRQNGIFLKSRDGRGGDIENFTGENLTILNSPTFLAVNLLNKGIQASDPVPGDPEKWTRLHNIRFEHIQVSNVADLVLAQHVPPARPIDGLVLADIKGTCARALTLANATNVAVSKIEVTGFSGALINKNNVHGTGLDDAQ